MKNEDTEMNMTLPPRPRKANECFIDPKKFAPAEPLFDEFWREGELALFFGASGTGKSILAVQIADALARGRPIEGFAMPRGHRKTLYVDLKLSDRQFQARYSRSADTLVRMSGTRTRRSAKKIMCEPLSPEEPAMRGERTLLSARMPLRRPKERLARTSQATRTRPLGPRLLSPEEPAMRTGVSALRYKFAENLYRDRPARTDDLCEWLRAMIAANGFRVVIIDDLSAIKRTHDGTRDTLALMRQLRQIKEEFNVSILVITDAETPREYVSEADLRRSRVLCSVADSVFAIGEHPRYHDQWCLIQTRSRNSSIRWDRRNAPVCKRVREDSGWLRLEFDERFTPKMDVETMRLINQIAWHKTEGESYRSIAEAIGLSKSHVARLHKKWTPELERRVDEIEEEGQDAFLNEEEFCDAEMERRGDAGNGAGETAGQEESETEEFIWSAEPEKDGTTKQHEITRKKEETENPQFAFCGPHSNIPQSAIPNPQFIPWAMGLARRTVYDLMWGEDGYGREIFIESEDEHTGKPTVWYKFDDKGYKIRYERSMFCVRTERLGASAYL